MTIRKDEKFKYKKVKLNGYEFELIPRKSCKGFVFAGDVDFATRRKDSVDSVIIGDETVYVCEKGKGNGRFIGAVLTDEGTYLRILKKNILPIILIPASIAAAILILCLIFADSGFRPVEFAINKVKDGISDVFDFDNEIVDIDPFGIPSDFVLDDDADKWDGELPVSGEKVEASAESIVIPGYADLVLNEKITSVQLINPDANTVHMVYTIKNGDNVIYESKGIAPGKMVTCDLYSMLEKGTYQLTFTISTYDVDTLTPCNGANQSVKVTCK